MVSALAFPQCGGFFLQFPTKNHQKTTPKRKNEHFKRKFKQKTDNHTDNRYICHQVSKTVSKMAKPRINRKAASGLLTLKFTFHKDSLPFAWSTGQHCNAADWNPATGRAKVRDAINQPHLTDLNSLLNRMCDEVLSCHRQHLGKTQLTKELYKAHMDAKFRPAPEAMALTLPAHIMATIAERQKTPTKAVANTLDSMADIAKMLQRFAADTRASLDIERIDRTWLDNFTRWAYSQQYSKGSVGLYITRIKATIKDAHERRIVDVDYTALKSYSVKAKRGETNKLYLEPEEVAAIAAFDYLSAGPYTLPNLTGYAIGPERLQRCAHVIVANCHTGTRHSDLSKLTAENLKSINGKKYLEITTEKTKARVLIPIFGQLLEIFEQLGHSLPTISKMELQVVGRAVLHMAGIERTVAFRDTKGGRLTTTHLPIWQKFAAHICRRTFARTAYMTDPSLLPNIQLILGHATPEQTLDYMDLTDAFSADAFVRKMERQAPTKLRAVK